MCRPRPSRSPALSSPLPLLQSCKINFENFLFYIQTYLYKIVFKISFLANFNIVIIVSSTVPNLDFYYALQVPALQTYNMLNQVVSYKMVLSKHIKHLIDCHIRKHLKEFDKPKLVKMLMRVLILVLFGSI